MLQKDELFPWRTIEKNVFLPLEIKKINTAQRRAKVIALAEKYGLKLSGGTDFHGTFKPHISIGRGLGGLEIPDSVLEKMKKRQSLHI